MKGYTAHIPNLVAQDISYAKQHQHVQRISQALRMHGILKVVLGFPDESSKYLQSLMYRLHERHGHGLPISHSASRGWFWDVRPRLQNPEHQARSETTEEFPWHTDCSYETAPPRFFARQVLQPDRHGGGTLSVMNVERLGNLLSPRTVASLLKPHYRFTIPPEFVKDSSGPGYIVGSVLAANKTGRVTMVRFREDIITPLNAEAQDAFQELKRTLLGLGAQNNIIHLTPEYLPRNAIVLMDNYRWLHARNQVMDQDRHLRRVRWDATPFPSRSEVP
ncbi:hypothetical protein BDV18DRAFT_121880 [Aspergillus unguis]